MRHFALLMIVSIVFTSGTTSADEPPKAKAPNDPIRVRLNEAKDKYRAAVERAGKVLTGEFDVYEKLLRDNKLPKKLNATDQLKALDQLEEERKAFTAVPPVLPRAEGMKKAKADYELSLKKARDLCDKAYSDAETAYQGQPDPTSGKKPNRTAILALGLEKEEFYKGGGPVGGIGDGGVVGGVGGVPGEDLRKVWKPAKIGSTFEWIREGEWKEVYADRSGAKFFKEVSRTDKQIELYAKTFSLHYRIESDKVWVRMDPEAKWRVYSEGGWSNDVPEAPAEKVVKIDWAAVKKATAKMTMAQLRDDRAGEAEVGTQAVSPTELESLVNATYSSKQSGSAYVVSGVEGLKATNAAIAAWKSLAAMATNPNVPEKSRLQVLDVTIAKATAAEEVVANPVVRRAFGDWAKLLTGLRKGGAAEDDVKDVLVGTWQVVVGNYRATWEFKKDGTISQSGSTLNGRLIDDTTGKWSVEAEKKRVLLKWENGTVDQVDLPISPKGMTGAMVGRTGAALYGQKK